MEPLVNSPPMSMYLLQPTQQNPGFRLLTTWRGDRGQRARQRTTMHVFRSRDGMARKGCSSPQGAILGLSQVWTLEHLENRISLGLQSQKPLSWSLVGYRTASFLWLSSHSSLRKPLNDLVYALFQKEVDLTGESVGIQGYWKQFMFCSNDPNWEGQHLDENQRAPQLRNRHSRVIVHQRKQFGV